MSTVELHVDIARPPEVVFPYLADPEKLQQWMSGLVESELLTEGVNGVGATSREVVEANGRRMELLVEVTAYEPNERLVADITSSAFDITAEYRLETIPDGTRVHYRTETQLKGFMRLFSPFMERTVREKFEADLAALKRRVAADD